MGVRCGTRGATSRNNSLPLRLGLLELEEDPPFLLLLPLIRYRQQIKTTGENNRYVTIDEATDTQQPIKTKTTDENRIYSPYTIDN